MTALDIVKQMTPTTAYNTNLIIAAETMVRARRSRWLYVTQWASGACLFLNPNDDTQTTVVITQPKTTDELVSILLANVG